MTGETRQLTTLFSQPVTIAIVCLFSFIVLTGAAAAQHPVPLINDPLVPHAVKPGGLGFTLTVNGTGFVSGAVVDWNSSPLTTKFVNSSRLTATVPASDIAKEGTVSVTVVNPGPGGGRSNVEYFTVHAPIKTFTVATTNIGSNEFTERPVLADLNGDGKLDLIGEGAGADAITVRLGNGDGTFQPEVTYATASNPSFPVVGDFNGDGKPDIAVLCEAGVVSVLLGNGDGTFQAHIDSPVDAGLHNFSIAAGDLNRDGKLDLVVGYQDLNNSAVSVLLGNGDGTFQAPVDYATGSEPGFVAIADLNRDGKLDIVAANFGDFGGDTVSVLLGKGDGTFEPQVQYPTSTGALALAVADFNGDGILDLAVDAACGGASRCGYPGEISILLGNGDGSFKPYVDYPADAFPYSLAAGDLLANGKMDLAVSDLDYSELSLLLGNGNGTFGAATTFSTSNRAVGVALGDLNGDGAMDVVVGTDAGFTIFLQSTSVSLSTTSLTFGTQAVETVSAAQKITLSNTGAITLSIGGIAISGANGSEFAQTNDCGSSLEPGANCTIIATFHPSTVGPASAAISITDNTADSPQSVSLSGTGLTGGPNVTLSASSLTFATQVVNTTSAGQAITLTNYGREQLNLQSISITGANRGDFSETNNCASSLATLANCTITVAFTPTASGSRVATLSLADNGPGSQQKVPLHGVGTVVAFNPASLKFPFVVLGHSSTLSATMTNVGAGGLSISGITIAGADAGDFSQTNNCGSSLSGGASCTITVVFAPKRTGSRTASVSVSDNGGGSPQQLSLTGTGGTIIPKCCTRCINGRCFKECPCVFIGENYSPARIGGADAAAAACNAAGNSLLGTTRGTNKAGNGD